MHLGSEQIALSDTHLGFEHVHLHLSNLLTCDFQQCGSLKNVDSGEPIFSPVKLRNFR